MTHLHTIKETTNKEPRTNNHILWIAAGVISVDEGQWGLNTIYRQNVGPWFCNDSKAQIDLAHREC